MNARKLLSRNCTPGDCAVCGGNAAGGIPIRKAVSQSFTDWQALMAAPGNMCCPACKSILANPLSRSKCLFCTSPGQVRYISHPEVREIILSPPERFVLSVTYSYKRHHWLYAGLCSPTKMLIGTDAGTLVYEPSKHAAALDAVTIMLNAGVTASQIKEGNYHPATVTKFGQDFAALESLVSACRGLGLIKLFCAIAVKEKNKSNRQGDMSMRTEAQSTTVQLLNLIAASSGLRARSGLQFWGGLFEHHIARVIGMPFDQMISMLMDALECYPNSDTSAFIDGLTNELKAEIMETLRKELKLCIGYTYADRKKEGNADDC